MVDLEGFLTFLSGAEFSEYGWFRVQAKIPLSPTQFFLIELGCLPYRTQTLRFYLVTVSKSKRGKQTYEHYESILLLTGEDYVYP